MSSGWIVVDLDGTLLRSDTLLESILRCLKVSFFIVLKYPIWLTKGRAYLKEQLAKIVDDIGVESLPYDQEIFNWLVDQKKIGKKLALCTASNIRYAEAIATHLGIFEKVIASTEYENLKGVNKADRLCELFGAKNFVYVGDSRADYPIWSKAKSAVIVAKSRSFEVKVSKIAPVDKVFYRPIHYTVFLRLIRLHQWPKNLLIFSPLIVSKGAFSSDGVLVLIAAFFSMSCVASAVYVINDLLDLETDRKSQMNSTRPLANGEIPLFLGLVIIPILLLAGALIAVLINDSFKLCLLVYFTVTCLYSFRLKFIRIFDCLLLSSLFTCRIVAGVLAVDLEATFWMLDFSLLFFFSLATLKRYVELRMASEKGIPSIRAGTYLVADMGLVRTLGIGLGIVSILIFSLYLEFTKYSDLKLLLLPDFLSTLSLLGWILMMWDHAVSGKISCEPVTYALKNKASLLLGFIFLSSLLGRWAISL